VALGDKARTFGISVLIHAGLAALLLIAAPHVIERVPELIELEIVPPPAPPSALEEEPPPPAPPPVPEPPPPPAVPTQKRPERVPEQVKVVQIEEARPFQENAPDETGTRKAPENTEAVPMPTMPVLDLATTVGTGTSEYVTTTSSAGDVPVMAGPGGGRGGAGVGSGAPGPLAHQGAVGVQVSRDWQITAMPEALNDRDFEPAYPATARHEGREAVVSVRLHIDAAGVVRHAEVLEAPPGDDGGFRASALAYVKKLRFRPARAGSTPVGARIDWTVYFYVHN
jgi:TonB family protein